jgi:hypothetical protein
MFEKKFILENLQKTYCHRCGASLEGAKLITITEAPVALVAHAVCPVCKAESMVTITATGSGTTPVRSDLMGEEYKKFIGIKPVSYEELLDLHLALKKEKTLWKLMQKKEKKSENNQEA